MQSLRHCRDHSDRSLSPCSRSYLSIYLQNRLPAEVPENAVGNGVFVIAGAAKTSVDQCAPHPIGSQEHAVVRDHILSELSNLGLTPETQKTIAVNTRWVLRLDRYCGERFGAH